MQLELSINFDGNCREAVALYAKVFKSEVKNLMTFSQAPPHPDFPVAEADKDKVLYCDLTIGGIFVMFMDMPTGSPLVKGNNVTPTLSMNDKAEVERIFNELAADGKAIMQLQPTFFSELYGMVEDKFGIIWQILHYVREESEC